MGRCRQQRVPAPAAGPTGPPAPAPAPWPHPPPRARPGRTAPPRPSSWPPAPPAAPACATRTAAACCPAAPRGQQTAAGAGGLQGARSAQLHPAAPALCRAPPAACNQLPQRSPQLPSTPALAHLCVLGLPLQQLGLDLSCVEAEPLVQQPSAHQILAQRLRLGAPGGHGVAQLPLRPLGRGQRGGAVRQRRHQQAPLRAPQLGQQQAAVHAGGGHLPAGRPVRSSASACQRPPPRLAGALALSAAQRPAPTNCRRTGSLPTC